MPVSLSALEIAFWDAFFHYRNNAYIPQHAHIFSNTLLYCEFVGSVDSRCTPAGHSLLNCHTECT